MSTELGALAFSASAAEGPGAKSPPNALGTGLGLSLLGSSLSITAPPNVLGADVFSKFSGLEATSNALGKGAAKEPFTCR